MSRRCRDRPRPIECAPHAGVRGRPGALPGASGRGEGTARRLLRMTVAGMPVIPAARGRHSRIIFRLRTHPAGINSIHGQSGFTNARVSPARPGLARRTEAAAAAGIYRRRRGAIRPDGRRTGGAGRGGARRALSRAGAAALGRRVQPRALAVRQRERRGGRRPGGVRARAALRRCVPRRQRAAMAADDRASHLVHRVAPAHPRARGRGA